MNVAEYTYLLNHPDGVNKRFTEALEHIVTEFPYFQSARALRLKGLYNEDSFRYNYALKVAAAYTTDRGVLFDFITSDSFTLVNKGLYERQAKAIMDLNVSAAETVEFTEDTAPESPEFIEAIRENSEEWHLANPELSAPLPPQTEMNPPDPATRSVLESIRESAPKKTEPEYEIPSVQPEHIKEVETVIEVQKSTVEQADAESTVAEEKLEIGKPLEFSQQELHSFREWLQISAFQPIVREQEEKTTEPQIQTIQEVHQELAHDEAQLDPEVDTERKKKLELIDKFIETNPKIPQVKPETSNSFIQVEPSRAADTSYLMTETLARVYLEQRKYDKAIQAYEILILKYPEKSSFFADRILDIRNLQQK